MRRRPALPITAVYREMETAPISEPKEASYVCDLCDRQCEGEPAGKGLLLFWRGVERRFDEPPLCEDCARQITIGAVGKWALEDEEEG